MSSDVTSHPSAVLSAIYPGLGQMFNGTIIRGFVLMFLAGVSAFLVLLSALMFFTMVSMGVEFAILGLGVILYLPVWIYAVYNASQMDKKR